MAQQPISTHAEHISQELGSQPCGAKNTVFGDKYFWVVLGVYAICAGCSIPFYRFQIHVDGVFYIHIAQKYAAGHFWSAVNSVWTPLHTWLLAIPLLAGMSPLPATKLITCLYGACCLASVWKLTLSNGVLSAGRICVGLALIPLLLFMAMFYQEPDLVGMALMMWYLALVSDQRGSRGLGAGLLVGAIGGVAYLAKAYYLPFFAVHFGGLCVLQLIRLKGSRRRTMIYGVSGLLASMLVAAPWIAVISTKYHHFTINDAARLELLSEHAPGARGLSVLRGFVAPSEPDCINAHEDYGNLKVPNWNPMASGADIRWMLGVMLENFKDELRKLKWYSLLSLPMAAVAGAAAMLRLRKPGSGGLLIIVWAAIVFSMAFLPGHVEHRYMFPVVVLLMIMGVLLIDVHAQATARGWWTTLLTVVLCAAFAVNSYKFLIEHRWTRREVTSYARRLAQLIPPGSSVASDGRWSYSLYVSSEDGLTYWGSAEESAGADEIRADLVKKGIEYFLIWGDVSRYPFARPLADARCDDGGGPMVWHVDKNPRP